ncbi:hypothetical protein BGW80DRAFT_1301597 [Lactifluus volemus]|nr:hypothetical protein BGW80DRAFT_1301597 [Lactifluus volemus]
MKGVQFEVPLPVQNSTHSMLVYNQRAGNRLLTWILVSYQKFPSISNTLFDPTIRSAAVSQTSKPHFICLITPSFVLSSGFRLKLVLPPTFPSPSESSLCNRPRFLAAPLVPFSSRPTTPLPVLLRVSPADRVARASCHICAPFKSSPSYLLGPS